GKRNHVGVVDVSDEDTKQNGEATTFYDSNNPAFKPAKQVEAGQKKRWKRKLVSWSFLVLVIGGGAVALYQLLKINRVNVRVNPDARRELVNAKPKTDSGKSENVLTA